MNNPRHVNRAIEVKNYEKLLILIPNLLQISEYTKLKSPSGGFMDLSVDILEKNKDSIIIALSHYYQHPDTSDMIPDPDMQLRLFPQEMRVEAMTYQDAFRYDQVYVQEGVFKVGLKFRLDSFLSFWLDNLLEQGHN